MSDREHWQNWCLVISGAEKKTCSADEFSFSAALGSKFERTSRKGFDNTHGAKRSHGFFEKFQPRLGFVWPGAEAAEVWLSVSRFLSRCHETETLSVSFCCYCFICFKQQLTTTNWLWQGSRNVWYNADVSVSPSIYLSVYPSSTPFISTIHLSICIYLIHICLHLIITSSFHPIFYIPYLTFQDTEVGLNVPVYRPSAALTTRRHYGLFCFRWETILVLD